MKAFVTVIFAWCFCAIGCQSKPEVPQPASTSSYFAATSDEVQTGGIKMVDISTPKGKFKVWTKRFGNNPKMKLLLLNGGPGATHEYFECMENFLPADGIEFIYYDQLGTGFSDNPDDTAFWDLDRYVEEVEQVRKALDLTKDNFFLLGHSWGGILAMEYSLKYPDQIKGLIISNMMSSAPAYDKYSDVLAAQMDSKVLESVRRIEAEKDFSNPEYMRLLEPHFYEKHILRMPMANWPEPVKRSFARINQSLYISMQGPSEFGISGKLTTWDRSDDLKNIRIPTLVIGAKYDTMDPEHMEWMSRQFPNGRYLYCENGSHMCMYDDQKTYFEGLTKFILSVN